MPPSETITKGDLYEALATLQRHVDTRRDAESEAQRQRHHETSQRLDRIDGHLNRLNGSVLDHAKKHSAAEVQIKNLEREVFDRRDESAKPATPVAPDPDTLPALTKGDLSRALKVAGAIIALIEIAPRLLAFLKQVMQ